MTCLKALGDLESMDYKAQTYSKFFNIVATYRPDGVDQGSFLRKLFQESPLDDRVFSYVSHWCLAAGDIVLQAAITSPVPHLQILCQTKECCGRVYLSCIHEHLGVAYLHIMECSRMGRCNVVPSPGILQDFHTAWSNGANSYFWYEP
jgi:hypothetical protein